MIDPKLLLSSVRKFYARSAEINIKNLLRKNYSQDIASLLQELNSSERIDIFLMLDDLKKRSEVFSYLNSESQKEILLILKTDEVSLLIHNMDKDDAANLLKDLDEKHSRDILIAMEDNQEVKELMTYCEDTAGALMNKDVLAVNENKTVSEAIQTIQSLDRKTISFYLYVVDESSKLVGLISLRSLLLSDESILLKNLMSKDVIYVNVNTRQDQVSEIVERYDFLALPVVNDEKKLMGVITVDDVIDVIKEQAEEDILAMAKVAWLEEESFLGHLKARFSGLLTSYLVGFICFSLAYFLGESTYDQNLENQITLITMSVIPFVIIISTTIVSQIITVSIPSFKFASLKKSWGKYFFRELSIYTLFSVIFSTLFFCSFYFYFRIFSLSLILSCIFCILFLFWFVIAYLSPYFIKKMNLSPMPSIPFFVLMINILSVLLVLFISKILI